MSQVRTEIEKILGFETSVGYIDKRKGGYRLKLVTHREASTTQIDEIMDLTPHIIKVGFAHTTSRGGYRGSWSEGVTIFFDCRLRDIKLNEEPVSAKGDEASYEIAQHNLVVKHQLKSDSCFMNCLKKSLNKLLTYLKKKLNTVSSNITLFTIK